LRFIVVILAGDISHFELSVLFNLVQNFSILSFDLLNLTFHLLDLGVLNLDFLAVGFLLDSKLLHVVFGDLVEGVLVHESLLLLLDLQLVEPT